MGVKRLFSTTMRALWGFSCRSLTLFLIFGVLHAGFTLFVIDGGPVFFGNVYAKEDDGQRKYGKTKTKKRSSVGKKCGGRLELAQIEIEAERWAEGERILKASLSSDCVSGYEKSQVWNFLAYSYYSRDNIKEAINSYKKVLAEPETDERMRASIYYSIAQLYFVSEDYENAANNLEAWMKEASVVGADGKVLLAQAYYQLEKKEKSLGLLSEVIAEWVKKGKVPKENWWGLQRVIFYEKQDYKQTLAILKKLVEHYPKYSYWRQMGGVYSELGQDTNRLISTELVYLAGNTSKERELLSLAYLFIGADAPYLAARVIEKGFKDKLIKKTQKNMELLGHAWQQAQDGNKARPYLEEAAKLSNKGTIWARLAGVYLDMGEDAKAIRASRNALNKGGLKRKDLTYMVLGNAQLNLHCYKDAALSFEKATKDKRSARFASKWITYAGNEGSRRNQLREMGADIAGCSKT
ncbi:MAG: tetratricopeptide repeat protein [Candidatus Reddybacter sp.]